MMTRRLLLLFPLAAGLRADAARDAWDLLSEAASSLAAGDAAAFLDCFDAKMDGYRDLRAEIVALLRETEPRSSITLVSNTGGDTARRLQIDWALNLVLKQDQVTSTRREARVRCDAEKQNRRWRITRFDPIALFAPLS